jgi:hypothetical protein
LGEKKEREIADGTRPVRARDQAEAARRITGKNRYAPWIYSNSSLAEFTILSREHSIIVLDVCSFGLPGPPEVTFKRGRTWCCVVTHHVKQRTTAVCLCPPPPGLFML